MGFDISRIKENAKTHYSVNKWNNVAVIFIWMIINNAVSGITTKVNSSDFENIDPESVEKGDEFIKSIMALAVVGVTSVASFIEFAITLFVINVLTMGLLSWYHKSIFADKLDVARLFDPFKVKYLDNVLTMLLKTIFIALWSLLLFIPGIVKSYAYSMTEFIKTENPNVSPRQAIDISKKMTEGHKMDLFVLDLHFIGWHILSAFTCGILELVYVGPYYYAAKAFAYEELKAEALANGKITDSELGG